MEISATVDQISDQVHRREARHQVSGSEVMSWIVTCNGVKYTAPLTREAAEKYRAMRLADRKNPRLTGPKADEPANKTYGAMQTWELVEVP
jgi:hypothetical protein